MQTIVADGYEIEIDSDHWQIYEGSNGHSVSPLCLYTQGDTVLLYSSSFARQTGLPDTQLTRNQIEAVLVGYHESTERWLLGIHYCRGVGHRAVFKPLVRWQPAPPATHRLAVRTAARSLAILLACPLKIFGDHKLPTETKDPTRSGYTGPLSEHERQRYEPAQLRAEMPQLPLQGQGFTLSENRHGFSLKLGKALENSGIDSPAFHLVDVNCEAQQIRLVSPTGLLSAFLGTDAYTIPFADVYNIELRQIEEAISENIDTGDQYITQQILTTRHSWSVHLTVAGESILIAMNQFTRSPELTAQRAVLVGASSTDTHHFRRHLEEQKRVDHHHRQMFGLAAAIALRLDRPLVETRAQI